MKIFKILLVVAIAFGIMACNNEEVPQLMGEKDASISIKVFPSSDGPSFRAVGDLSGNGVLAQGIDAESAIKKLEVWVFNGDVLKAYGTAAGNEIKDLETSVGESTIVVTANTSIGIKGSKTDVLKEFSNLPGKDISTSGLVMTAEPFVVNLVAGNNYYGYTETEVADKTATKKNHLNDGRKPLAISRVNARVALVSAVLDYTNVPENQQAVFTKLGDIEVAMFNVPNQTNLFYARTLADTTLAKNDAFQFGAAWTSPKYSYVKGTANAILSDKTETNSSIELPITAASAPYYYVNENTSEVAIGTLETPAQKMFMVLRAKVYKGTTVVTELEDLYTDDEGYTYYPVWVNKDGLTESNNVGNGNVYRNTQYNISIKIKGLGRPTIDEVDKAWLDVKVTVTPWAVVTQNVTW